MPSRNISAAEVQGIVVGAFFLAFFGAIWALGSAFVLEGLARQTLLVIAGIGTVVLFAITISLLRIARRLPAERSPQEALRAKGRGWRFGMVSFIEFALIALAVTLCNLAHHPQLITPVVALIIGLHFFPLARLFGARDYYWTGTALSVLGSGVALVVLLQPTIGGLSSGTWPIVVSLGSVAILWLTALRVLTGGFSLVKRAVQALQRPQDEGVPSSLHTLHAS